MNWEISAGLSALGNRAVTTRLLVPGDRATIIFGGMSPLVSGVPVDADPFEVDC